VKANVLLFFLTCVLSAGCASRQPTPAPVPSPLDWTVTATWNFDFTNFVVCSATVTKGCVSGFTWGYLQGATPVPLKTSPPTVCTGTTQPRSCTDTANATVGIGAVMPYAIANGFDNNGAAVTSAVVNGTPVNVQIGLPTNVNETFN
jgi:hypothetical protein